MKIESDPMRPGDWPMWRVVAIRGGKAYEQTFVRASSEIAAKNIGKSALRMLGVRGRYDVRARRYYPWFDPALRGFVGVCTDVPETTFGESRR